MSTLLAPVKAPSRWARLADSDLWYSFRHSPTAIVAALIALLCVVCAVFAHWIAPHNPFDLATLDLLDARLPPAWVEGGSSKYLLGTDDQGRDILSALMYGSRISLFVGLASVALSMPRLVTPAPGPNSSYIQSLPCSTTPSGGGNERGGMLRNTWLMERRSHC